MKRLLLVSTNTETKPYPVLPIGICMIANSVRETYETLVFDGTSQSPKELPGVLRDFNPDYIGFSIRNIDDMVYDKLTWYLDSVLQDFILPVREATDVPIILGGAGFSIYPVQIMKRSRADYGISGAGEEVFPALLQALDRGETGMKLPGLLKRDDLEDIKPARIGDDYYQPFTRIHQWLNLEAYRQRGSYSIQTKRGCQFSCVYCTYPGIEGKHLRVRRTEDIVDEMQEVWETVGDIGFEFVDSVFNDPPGHAEAICREIIKRGLSFPMRTMGVNPRHVSRELLELMLAAGFKQIDCTPDTASPTMLKNMGKNFEREHLEKTAVLIREMKLPAMWFFIFGGPGENEETIRESFDFIDHFIAVEDMVHVTAGLRVYPGTPLEKTTRAEGLISDDNDLLQPFFYFSSLTPPDVLDRLLREQCSLRSNCILSSESAPPPEMMAQAVRIRREQALDEPMFRTLMRIRNENHLKNNAPSGKGEEGV